MKESHSPKYKVLADWIKSRIDEGEFKEGEKLPTEKQFSEKFSLSRQTVRQALSILESDRIITSRRGSGTYVAYRHVKQGNTMCVGLITTYISEYMFPNIIRGIEEELTDQGYTIRFSATRNRVDNERKILQEYLENPVDGLIVEGTKSALPNPNIDLYRSFQERGIPIVFINSYYQELKNPVYVITDDRSGGNRAVRFLVERGHKKIAGIFKSDDAQGHSRYDGFARAMIESGLELRDDSVHWFTTENLDTVLFNQNSSLLIDCLKECTAVVCYNDEIAIRLVKLLNAENIRIPEDIAIISFDNSAYSELSTVRITSFSHPKDLLGQEAARKLINMINWQDEQPAILDWKLIIKDSV